MNLECLLVSFTFYFSHIPKKHSMAIKNTVCCWIFLYKNVQVLSCVDNSRSDKKAAVLANYIRKTGKKNASKARRADFFAPASKLHCDVTRHVINALFSHASIFDEKATKIASEVTIEVNLKLWWKLETEKAFEVLKLAAKFILSTVFVAS